MSTAMSSIGRHGDAARGRVAAAGSEPLLMCDWQRATFIHYEVEPHILQPMIPYELDLYGGRAYVSLVAFTLRRFRTCIGQRVVRWAAAPFANHAYFNVRTYVVHEGGAGIYFMAEWVPRRLSMFIGPRTYGLPLRFGSLDYEHRHEVGRIAGRVRDLTKCQSDAKRQCDGRHGGDDFEYDGRLKSGGDIEAAADPLTQFLVERYTAYTCRREVYRRFRIWHEPWTLRPLEVNVSSDRLLDLTGDWPGAAQLAAAHYSSGVRDVRISRPQWLAV